MKYYKVLLTTFFLTIFIYFEYFNITNKLINTIFALFAFYYLLTINKKELFFSVFFTSILWFWWIGYSFIYYDLSYLIPIIFLAIGFIYGILFYIGGIINNIYYRACWIFILSFIYPFGFNWFELELLFINTYFNITKISFALILIALILIIKLQYYKKYLAIIPLLFSINYTHIKIPNPQFKIYMANTNILQKEKWKKENLQKIIQININEINKAIKQKADLIILPETTLPLVLNKHYKLINLLKNKSKQINIIIGSLYIKNNKYYNSTYFFNNEKINIANKVVLIPFGEAVPFPKLIKDFINDTFYNGAKDYEKAKKPTDFIIKGIQFRNAICYEATTDQIFQNLKGNYVIATSNNAWFMPSIQSTLQNLLLKYYAQKYNVKIFNVSNMSQNNIIN